LSRDLPGLGELPGLKALESLLKALARRAQRMSEEQRLAWLHGFAFGDASLSIPNVLGLETSRLDTLLAFLAVAISFANYDRYGLRAAKVYPYIRAASDVKSLEKHKWYAHIYVCSDVYYYVSSRYPSSMDSYKNSLTMLSAFTAGFIDSDGAIVMSVKKRRRKLYFEPELYIVNSDVGALAKLRSLWLEHGVLMNLHKHSPRGTIRGFTRLRRVWRLRTGLQSEISKILKNIIPYMFNLKRLARAVITKSYVEGAIPRDPKLIMNAIKRLNNYYEQKLKYHSRSLVEKLVQKDLVLAVLPDGSIELTVRTRPLDAKELRLK